MTFDDILETLESDNKILDFRFAKSQIPMYLVIRFILIQSLINKEFSLSNPHIKANKKPIKEILKYIYYTVKSNIFFAPKKDIYIFSSDILNILDSGKYKNRLHNNFCEIFDNQTQVFEISHNLQYKEPKYKEVYFIDFIYFLRKLFWPFIGKRDKDLNNIELLMVYIQEKIFMDASLVGKLRNILKKYSTGVYIESYLYELFIKIKRPKILIIDCAYYSVYTPLVLVAKKYNIKTVEYQHGYVGLSHPAYNYSNAIYHQIKKYFPEYFLTFGKYWSDSIRIPSKKIEIGLAELENYLKLKKSIAKEKSILFISGGTVYKELNLLIDATIQSFHTLGYTVILRTHPSEKIDLHKRYGNLLTKGLMVDNLTLYERLSKTEIVVGMEVSTVLFEAICFTNKVYIQDTRYTRFYESEPKFILFQNANQLLSLVQKDTLINFDMSYCWVFNSAISYNVFIRKLLKKFGDK